MPTKASKSSTSTSSTTATTTMSTTSTSMVSPWGLFLLDLLITYVYIATTFNGHYAAKPGPSHVQTDTLTGHHVTTTHHGH
jgi:hypothetical protein